MKPYVTELPIGEVYPNKWNPNRQNERQFQAEVESILTYGFLAPILVRPIKQGWEILDGEHRHRAMETIIAQNLKGEGELTHLTSKKLIPAMVIEIDDVQAKKLTIIMNETRGEAELGELSKLLESIQAELGDETLIGMPYTDQQLADLLSLGNTEWAELEPVELEPASPEDDESGNARIIALLSPNAELLWKERLIQNAAYLPKDEKLAAGKLIEILLTTR